MDVWIVYLMWHWHVKQISQSSGQQYTVYSSISQKIKIQNIENREGVADMIVPSRPFDRQFGRKFKNGW